MQDKAELRRLLRSIRREHAASIPETMRGLVFRHPPARLLDMIAEDAEIGLYHATKHEAPSSHYATYFHEQGYDLALPHFSSPDASMQFRTFSDPYNVGDLEMGPFGILQPTDDLYEIVPDVVFVPLIGFTKSGERLGQGGGHYDRWLAEHPESIAIGLAWDCQLVDCLPTEPHDRKLSAVVTPTRFYGPFDA